MLLKTLCFNRSFNKKAEETFNMIKPITDAQSRWLVESVVYATYHPVRKTATVWFVDMIGNQRR